MADWYLYSGTVGTLTHPVTGKSTLGVDTGQAVIGVTPADPTDATSLAPRDPTTPFLSWNGNGTTTLGLDGNTSITTGDRIFAAGRCRIRVNSAAMFSRDGDSFGAKGLIFTQWPNMPALQLRAYVIPGGTITNNLTVSANYWVAATNGWKITLDGTNGKPSLVGMTQANLNKADVVFDYDDPLNIDGSMAAGNTARGRRTSHYAVAANVAAITGGTRGAQGKFFIDITTDSAHPVLYVLMATVKGDGSAQADSPISANANGFEVSFANTSAIIMKSTTASNVQNDIALSNFNVVGFSDGAAAAPAGCGVCILSSSNATLDNIFFEDSGVHAWSFGSTVTNPSVTHCNCTGIRSPGTIGVFDAGVGSATGICQGAVWALNNLLGHDAKRVTTGGVIGGYVHGSHQKIYWRDIIVDCYTPPAGGAYDIVGPFDSGNATAPSDLTRAAGMPIIVDNFQVNHCTEWANQTVDSYIGFTNGTVNGDKVPQAYGVGLLARSAATGRWIFEGCALSGDLGNGSGATTVGLAQVGATFTFVFINCSLYDSAASHSGGHTQGAFVYTAQPDGLTGFGFIVSGCIIGAKANDQTWKVCNGDGAFTNGHTFSNNLYYKVTADSWSEHASLNSDAEWLASVDTGTVTTATNPFTDTTGASLALTVAEQGRRLLLTTHTYQGVNLVVYAGNYGAWQYPTSAASYSSGRRRGGARERCTVAGNK